ncbi:hypothetical protein IJM86_04090 [bacterium]|nr:hypothetical protein [bacterium]
MTKKVARFWPHQQKTGGFFIAKLKKLAPLGEKQPCFPDDKKQPSLRKLNKEEKI